LKRSIRSHPIVSRLIQTGHFEDNEIGWGYKKSGLRAKKSNTAFTLLEDGFVRSLFPGYNYGTPYSLVMDSSGIYYDASGQSDLIYFLNSQKVRGEHWLKEIKPLEVSTALKRIRNVGISKYNCHLVTDITFQDGVLVVDQTAGDAAISYSGMDSNDFNRMLQDALDEYPESPIYVKTHPDHHYRQKHSCFSSNLLEHDRITILPNDISAADTFKFCHTVYVGSSLIGMEALIHNLKVITYSWTFYSGWGLTTDRCKSSKPERSREITIEELFEASYLRYTHYFDPDTQQPCDVHRIIDHIEHQHSKWKNNQQHWALFNLSPWQKTLITHFIGPKYHSIQNVKEPVIKQQFNLSTNLITWGTKKIPDNLKELPLTVIEDGFIRSRGLGAEFNFPLSWVFDDIGIYFDARSPSKLENILNGHKFSDKEISETKELIAFLRKNKITKYNIGICEAQLPIDSTGKRVILIPGQVDSDASIKYGSPKLSNNRELLAEVRRQHPNAYICYKPHPDLLKGARKDAPLWEGIENDVDHLITEGDIISWILAVDEVHTLTSTVGFEALLHQKPVYTYGLPFYAGWGLTHDWLTCERRTVKRTLNELACAALILYPTYLNPITKEFTTALNAAKMLTDPNFNYDSRTRVLKIIGKLKSFYYKIWRKF